MITLLQNFRKKIILLFLLLFCIYPFIYAQTISSTELLNNATDYDNKVITYEGEVIGDILKRGNYSWINIDDNNFTIGVWVETSLIKDITFTGNYKTEGDQIEVRGIFHKNCSQHGGDLDIHANEIRIIKKGRIRDFPLQIGKIKFIVILIIILFSQIMILVIKNFLKARLKKQ
ncbi:MAG: DNA-binding protein [Candidatus Omnitrophica bacterium]|nr:DNA-binding protein [Candidatus Omnitrophota bacterium]